MRSVCQTASVVLVIGGCTAIREEGSINTIEAFKLKSTRTSTDGSLPIEKWMDGTSEMRISRRAPSALPLHHHRAFAVIGGCSAPKTHLNSIEVIQQSNRENKKGSSKNSPEMNRIFHPSSLSEHSCAASCSIRQNTLVIVGGFDGIESLKSVYLVEINEKDEPSVRRLPDFCSPLKNGSMISIGEREAMVIGGWDGSRTLRTVFKLSFSEALDSYECEMAGLLPHPIEGHSVSRWNNYLFIVGGFDGISVTEHIIRLDLLTNTMEILPVKLRIPRENHTAQVIGNYLLVLGGWDGHKALDSIEIFELCPDIPAHLREIHPTNPPLRLNVPRNRATSIIFPS